MTGARTTDPPTSHLAAHKAESSGRAGGQRRVCLGHVLMFPGLTAAEIAVKAGMERHVPSRRLPELRRAGLVHNGTERVCEATGRMSMTWWSGKRRDQLELF